MFRKIKKLGRISFYQFCRFICFLTFQILWRLEVKGQKNVPRRGALILAANHKSYADPPLVGVALPRVAHYLAKRSLFKFPPIGWLLKVWHSHPISRAGGAEAIKDAVDLMEEGDALIVFPEGKRIRGEEFGQPKPGVGMLAMATKTPVIPVYVHNSNKMFKFKKLSVIFGQPIFPQDFHTYEKLAEEIMSAIVQLKESHFGKTS